MNIQYDYDLVSHSTLLLSTPYLETERVLVAGNDVDVTTLKEKKAAIYKGNVTEKYENTKNAVYYLSLIHIYLQLTGGYTKQGAHRQCMNILIQRLIFTDACLLYTSRCV